MTTAKRKQSAAVFRTMQAAHRLGANVWVSGYSAYSDHVCLGAIGAAHYQQWLRWVAAQAKASHLAAITAIQRKSWQSRRRR